MDVLIASGNPGKVREFRAILAQAGSARMRILDASDAPPQVAETGRSYVANARLKAHAYASQYSSPALGDDSGLAVDALGGAPGIRSARFGGPGLDDAGRIALLLQRLRSVPDGERGAHFVCALCLAWPDGSELVAHGRVHGRIAMAPSGAGGFGYDPVFVLAQLGCTMAALPADQKNRLSHRARAIRRLLRQLGEVKRAAGASP